MAKNFLDKLRKIDGALVEKYNPFGNVICTPSPSVNFTFGKSHGLPRGYSLCLYGKPKGGKSVICNSFIGQMHQDDPEAYAIKFDTEFREEAQNDSNIWGIDENRYQVYQANSPVMVFDTIEKDIAALCQDGMNLGVVIIDSINGVQGRRAMNAESIEKQQIGDHALTIQEGLKRILPIQRKYRFALIVTAHVRAEMDQLEVMRGNKVKMGAAFGVQHHCEYFMYVEPNLNKDGRSSLTGKEFKDAEMGDIEGNAEQTGHKIWVEMKDSSAGPKKRVGEFTLDYHKGIVNTHEEVFLLGVNRGVIKHPTNVTYELDDRTWHGRPACLEALEKEPDTCKAILKKLREMDLAGAFAAEDAKAERVAE